MAHFPRIRRLFLLLFGLLILATLLWLFAPRGTETLRFEHTALESFAQNPDISAYNFKNFVLNGILVVPSFHPRTDTEDNSIYLSFGSTQKQPSIAVQRFPTTDIHLDLYSKEPAQELHLTFLTYICPQISYSYEKDLMFRTGDQPDANGLYHTSAVIETEIPTQTLLYASESNNGYLRLVLTFKETPDATETMVLYYDFKAHLPSR